MTQIDFSLLHQPGFIPSVVMVCIFLYVMRKLSFSGLSIAFFSLVGTWLHEVSHYLVGLILGAKPVSFTLIPKKENDRWVLGSVGFARINIFNAAPVAFAPLLLFVLGVTLFIYVMIPAYQDNAWWLWFLMSYTVACCIFSGTPSSTDVQVGFLSGCLYAIIGFGIYSAIST